MENIGKKLAKRKRKIDRPLKLRYVDLSLREAPWAGGLLQPIHGHRDSEILGRWSGSGPEPGWDRLMVPISASEAFFSYTDPVPPERWRPPGTRSADRLPEIGRFSPEWLHR